MLTCKDVVYVKDNKRVIADVPFDRVYFEYGASDATIEKDSKAKSKNADGTISEFSHRIVVPVGVDVKDAKGLVLGNVSREDPSDLAATALERIAAEHPGLNPLWVLLSMASENYNLIQRKPIHESRRPKKAKALTQDQGVSKAATALVSSGLMPDMERAVAYISKLKAAA